MIVFPQDSMKSDLERLWRACFDDSMEYVRYFFENRYVPENCLVYLDESVRRPVAMLHLLDASVAENGGLVPTQYLYAACTRADCRRQGMMGQLIRTAIRLGQKRGKKYTVTVPADPFLFQYYQKRGFSRCYRVRSVWLTRKELAYLAKDAAAIPQNPRETMMKLDEVFAFRRSMLVDREGFVYWDPAAFRYAVGVHEYDGGHVVTLAWDGDFAYAFCRVAQGETVQVLECLAKEHFAPSLMKRILQCYPRVERFSFRLPVFDTFFSRFGEETDFAMICRNDGRSPVTLTTLEGVRTPYFGLPLD